MAVVAQATVLLKQVPAEAGADALPSRQRRVERSRGGAAHPEIARDERTSCYPPLIEETRRAGERSPRPAKCTHEHDAADRIEIRGAHETDSDFVAGLASSWAGIRLSGVEGPCGSSSRVRRRSGPARCALRSRDQPYGLRRQQTGRGSAEWARGRDEQRTRSRRSGRHRGGA